MQTDIQPIAFLDTVLTNHIERFVLDIYVKTTILNFNINTDMILFAGAISPCHRLSECQWEELHQGLRELVKLKQ